MRRSVRAVLLVFWCVVTICVAFAHEHDDGENRPLLATGDKIRIIALEPSGPVRHGRETKFNIEIEAELRSAKEGIARLWFNLRAPNAYRMVEHRDLREGRQRITFEVTVTPVDWANRGSFTVLVNMGPKATGADWAPTTFEQKVISVTP